MWELFRFLCAYFSSPLPTQINCSPSQCHASTVSGHLPKRLHLGPTHSAAPRSGPCHRQIRRYNRCHWWPQGGGPAMATCLNGTEPRPCQSGRTGAFVHSYLWWPHCTPTIPKLGDAGVDGPPARSNQLFPFGVGVEEGRGTTLSHRHGYVRKKIVYLQETIAVHRTPKQNKTIAGERGNHLMFRGCFEETQL